MCARITDAHGAAEKPSRWVAFSIVEAILEQTLLNLSNDTKCLRLSILSIPLNQHNLLTRPDNELKTF